MCRALLVVCVAPDRDSLLELKRASVGTDWELTPGATVVVNPADGEQEGEVRLSIVLPKKQKTPVGVGAEAAAAEESTEGETPPEAPPVDEQ